MEVDIAPETREALEADLTVRCLYRAKFNLDSRHSEAVIAWAETLVRTFSSSMLEKMGQRTTAVNIQLNVIQLLRSRKYALICFDIFLCDDRLRLEIDQSLEQPIHEVLQKGNVHRVQRNRRLDATVAAEYRRRRSVDKGPRPYFADLANPPVYDNGNRIEGLQNGEPDEDRSEEDMSEGVGPEEVRPEETDRKRS